MEVQALINKALRFKDNAVDVIKQMVTDSADLRDFIVKPSQNIITSYYKASMKDIEMYVSDNKSYTSSPLTIHKNAIAQIENKNGIKGGFLSALYAGDPWQKSLASTVMNQYFLNKNLSSKVLLRTVGNEVRGYLSDSYHRYSSVEVFKEFISMATAHNAVVSNAYYNDISSYVEALVLDPIMINGEEHLYGIQFRNSDFGGAALDMKTMFVKLICTNGMTRQSLLRQIHRSSKIDTINIELSKDTIEAETMTKKLMMRDFSNYIFDKEKIMEEVALLNKVGEIIIDIDKPIQQLAKIGASKSDIESIQALLMENDPNKGVHRGGNVMRVANAASYLANTIFEADKIAEYKDLSGKLISFYAETIKN